MRKWYGNLSNRLEEDRMFCDEIRVGTGMTEYMYTDRHPYEVIAVQDQKHVTVREMDHEHVGDGCMDNNWRLISNPANPAKNLVKIGDYWYWTVTVTAEDIKDFDNMDPGDRLRFVLGGWDLDKIRSKGKQTRRSRAKVSFGVADYYYCYEI